MLLSKDFYIKQLNSTKLFPLKKVFFNDLIADIYLELRIFFRLHRLKIAFENQFNDIFEITNLKDEFVAFLTISKFYEEFYFDFLDDVLGGIESFEGLSKLIPTFFTYPSLDDDIDEDIKIVASQLLDVIFYYVENIMFEVFDEFSVISRNSIKAHWNLIKDTIRKDLEEYLSDYLNKEEYKTTKEDRELILKKFKKFHKKAIQEVTQLNLY